VRDAAAIAFGPPVLRDATAEWRLHVVSRCGDGKINFCLADRYGLANLRLHCSKLEDIWIGARGGWNYAREEAMMFAGDVKKQLSPFLRGSQVSLRLHQRQLCVTHINANRQEETAVASLPEHFGTERPNQQPDSQRQWQSSATERTSHVDLPVDGVWCVVHHYAHDRYGSGDEKFMLERLE